MYRKRILCYAALQQPSSSKTFLSCCIWFSTHLGIQMAFLLGQVDKLWSTKSVNLLIITQAEDQLNFGVQARPNPASNDQLGCPAVSPEEFLMSLNLMISQKNSRFHWEYIHYRAFKVWAIHQEGLGNIEMAKLCITLFQFESILMCLLGLQCIVGHGSNSASPWLQLGD